MYLTNVFYHIAGCAMNIAHYGTVLAQQTIEQCALAYIGAAYYRNGNTRLGCSAGMETAEQLVYAVLYTLCQQHKLAAVSKLQVFMVAEIQFQLHQGGDML